MPYLKSQFKYFGVNSRRLRTRVLRDRQYEACGQQLQGYFVINSKPVIFIYEIASMVILCRVDNCKLKCKLTYAVSRKCGL